MLIRNLSYIFVGLFVGFSIAVIFSTVEAQYFDSSLSISDIVSDQERALKFTGMYIPDVSDPKRTINTYETICKGFYIIEDQGDTLVYTGFGDLAEQYTFKEEKPKVDINIISTSTIDEILLTPDPIVDIPDPDTLPSVLNI